MDPEDIWVCERCWAHPGMERIAEWETEGRSPCIHPDCNRMLGVGHCEEHGLPSYLVFMGFQP